MQGPVEFSAHVPYEDYKEFKENFPQYGAVKWFLCGALHQFNLQVRQDPSLKQKVAAAIQELLDLDRQVNRAVAAAEVVASEHSS